MDIPMRSLFFSCFALFFFAACAHGTSTHGTGTNGDDAGLGFDITPPPDDPNAACLAAEANHSSIGCEYYAVMMDSIASADNGCFVAFVANTSDKPAHLDVAFAGNPIDIAAHVKHPRGAGLKLTYED